MRAQFNLDPALAQFAAFVLSPHTKVLDAAIAGYRDELGADTESALLGGLELEEAVRHGRRGVRRRRRRTQYALTDSTTMGLGLMYGGLDLGPGDEVLTTTHDFYSTEEALRLLRRAHRRHGQPGHAVRRPGRGERRRDRRPAGRRRSPRARRSWRVTWVHSSTGVRLPVPRSARRSRA